MASLPAIVLEGAKGVGKTATATQRARTSRPLDRREQMQIARGDPGRVLEGDPPVLIDEWQRLPEVWDLVRRRVDDGAPAGQFLLAGSAPPQQPPMHSGAGRIVTVRMRPLSLMERDERTAAQAVSLKGLLSGRRNPLAGVSGMRLEDYVDEIVRSGFPGIRRFEGRARRGQLDSYLHRIVDRDFPDELGREVRQPDTFRRWMTAYAAASSTSASYERIRGAATPGEEHKPSRATATYYREALTSLWLLDPVPAWSPSRNHIRRLALPPKHQMADPALAARLLGVGRDELLTGSPGAVAIPLDGTLLGALFESLVTQSLRAYAQAAETARVSHLRTRGGEHEVDLIVERGDGGIVAIEVKLAASVEDSDCWHLHWLSDRIGEDLLDAVVITTGSEAYRRTDGIGVIPAAVLGP